MKNTICSKCNGTGYLLKDRGYKDEKGIGIINAIDCPFCKKDIYDEIKAERIRQDEKYGKDRNEPPEYWMKIIGEESAEVYNGLKNNTPPPHDYRTEMIQFVSLGVAAIESWDRQKESKSEEA